MKQSFQFTFLFCFKELDKVVDEFRSVCKQVKESSAAETNTNPLFEMGRLATVLYRQTGVSKV